MKFLVQLLLVGLFLNSHANAAQPAGDSSATCVDQWITAYRDDAGQDAPVRHDMLQEWTQWCAEGKQPNASAEPPSCVESWVNAYRDEVGQDALVHHEMLGEWEQWCAAGKSP